MGLYIVDGRIDVIEAVHIPRRVRPRQAPSPSVRIALLGATINLLIYGASNFESIATEAYYETAPLVMMSILIATNLTTCFYIVFKDYFYVLSPFPWFFLAAALNYGVGPTIYYFGNDMTLSALEYYFPVDRAALLKVTAVNSASVLLVGGVCHLSLRLRTQSRYITPRPMAPSELKKLALVFLCIGLPIQYLLIFPYEFGMTNFTLPGSILACGQFTSLATYVLVYLVAAGHTDLPLKMATVLFVVTELLAKTLNFSKMNTMVCIFMIFLGIFTVARRKSIVAVIFFVLMVGFYQVLMPAVDWCRLEVGHYGGKAGLADRLDIAIDYVLRGRRERQDDDTEMQLAWVRLNQVNAEAFVIDAYDRGEPGNSITLVFYALVPRLLWPGKPLITIGNDFNKLVTGSNENATGPGFIAEGYWNGGWLAVIAVGAYVGLVFSVFTKLIVSSLKVVDLRVLPLAFFGLFMGFQIQDWFASNYVNSLPITFFYYMVIYKLVGSQNDVGRRA